MKQALKIAIPVVALVAVVFGITFFAQYRPGGGEQEEATGGEPPLRFFSSERKWDPSPFASLQNRAFPGFYEAQANAAGTPNGAAFWFENRNPKAVHLQLRGVSCNSCSGGRVAAVPPEVARQILQMAGASSLPMGLFSGVPVGFAGAGAHLADDHLKWQTHIFRDDPHADYVVPACDNPTGWTPQWGILDLRFSVGAVAPKTLLAEFETRVEGTKQAGTAQFKIEFEGVEPFNATLVEINAGELVEASASQRHRVLVYSATRGPHGNGPGDLSPPIAAVVMPPGMVGDPGPFVSVEPPVRVPEAELPSVAALSSKPIRLESAYWMNVVVSPKVGDRRIDLGPLEREIHITSGGAQKVIKVKGRVTGDVYLADNLKDIDIKYPFAAGISDALYTVVTKNKDAEVVVVPDPAAPDFLQIRVERYPVEKTPPGSDQGYHYLKVTIPAGKKAGSWAGVVVLEAKGPNPQRIRIPVRGFGN